MEKILMVGFSGTLDTDWVENWKVIEDKLIDRSRFRGKLVKMIKDAGCKVDDYSIQPKNKQILLHWGYKLTEKGFFINLTN